MQCLPIRGPGVCPACGVGAAIGVTAGETFCRPSPPAGVAEGVPPYRFWSRRSSGGMKPPGNGVEPAPARCPDCAGLRVDVLAVWSAACDMVAQRRVPVTDMVSVHIHKHGRTFRTCHRSSSNTARLAHCTVGTRLVCDT